jgi:hypothetical protein
VDLEVRLEAEQEYVVNKLRKQVRGAGRGQEGRREAAWWEAPSSCQQQQQQEEVPCCGDPPTHERLAHTPVAASMRGGQQAACPLGKLPDFSALGHVPCHGRHAA